MKKTAMITIGSCTGLGHWADPIRRLGTLAARIVIICLLACLLHGLQEDGSGIQVGLWEPRTEGKGRSHHHDRKRI